MVYDPLSTEQRLYPVVMPWQFQYFQCSLCRAPLPKPWPNANDFCDACKVLIYG